MRYASVCVSRTTRDRRSLSLSRDTQVHHTGVCGLRAGVRGRVVVGASAAAAVTYYVILVFYLIYQINECDRSAVFFFFSFVPFLVFLCSIIFFIFSVLI